MLLAFLGAAVILTGVQAVLPALPAIQSALGLSDSQVSIVMSAYLLPSVLLAVPFGLLVDRVGRREVFVAALLLFGLAAIPQLLVRSFPLLIGMRVLQGAAFAAVLPLSITLIADVRTGEAGVRALGQRSVAMAIADAVLPAAGGLLAAWVWYAPFALQLSAIPVAVGAWLLLPAWEREDTPDGSYLREVGGLLRLEGVPALQALGFVRFFFKFGVLTYFPILGASARGLSAVVIGFAIGAAALTGALSAALAERIIRRVNVGSLVIGSLLVTAAALTVIAVGPWLVAVLIALVAWGAADGLLGVVQNSIAAAVAPKAVRGGFVAVTGTVRNLGKFIAPVTLGALVVAMTLPQSFVILAVAAVLAVVPLWPIRRLDWAVRAGADADLPLDVLGADVT